MNVLDNHVWHAVTGQQSTLARRCGDAARYDPDVSPFDAISGSSGSWDDLAALADEGALLFAPDVEVPESWIVDHSFTCLQFVAGDLRERRGLEVVRLGPDDVAEMEELVRTTEPGPFRRRTIEMGRYLGVRENDRLVAMAGERARPPGYAEISAVCTAPDWRRRGLGAELTLAVAEHIRSRGDEAFLHVRDTNAAAIALYLSIGFELRRDDVDVLVLRAPT